MLRLTSQVLDNLTKIRAELEKIFSDCTVGMVFDIDTDEDGILIVEVNLGQITVDLSFNLEQGTIITGEDSTELLRESVVWRQIAYGLLREIERKR